MPEATTPLRPPTMNLSDIKAILIPLDKRRMVHRLPSHGTPLAAVLLQAFPIPLGGTFTFGKKGRGNEVFFAGLQGMSDTETPLGN